MKTKVKYTVLLLLILAAFSCKKTEDTVPDKSRFYHLSEKPHVTPFSLYKIYDPGNGEITYALNFYEVNVEYDAFYDTFYGFGNMLELKFNTSLFKEGLAQEVFKVDNLQEGIIKIKDGTAWLAYDFTYNKSGSKVKITEGTLTVWKYQDRYKMNYKLSLEDGSQIEGAFWDAMSVVYK